MRGDEFSIHGHGGIETLQEEVFGDCRDAEDLTGMGQARGILLGTEDGDGVVGSSKRF